MITKNLKTNIEWTEFYSDKDFSTDKIIINTYKILLQLK